SWPWNSTRNWDRHRPTTDTRCVSRQERWGFRNSKNGALPVAARKWPPVFWARRTPLPGKLVQPAQRRDQGPADRRGPHLDRARAAGQERLGLAATEGVGVGRRNNGSIITPTRKLIT